ncbi:hypothetical protein ZWY2020_055562 [Hordeum vulgare]|nr:hypothetical protein ZWY2020_055562 [Hordeum vulgare]
MAVPTFLCGQGLHSQTVSDAEGEEPVELEPRAFIPIDPRRNCNDALIPGEAATSDEDDWSNEEKQWEACGSKTKITWADKYAKESELLACDAYEGLEQGNTLGDDYYFRALPVVEKRIAHGV